jgi:heparan-alpha-glucosaminide N-acetyltransferase
VDRIESLPHQSSPTAAVRLASVDAFRGFVMLLMLAEVLRSCAVSAALVDSHFWRSICQQQTHASWVGASLHDLIAPSFYFLVGVALLLSMRRRLSSGQAISRMSRHTIVRSLALVVLGMALFSVHLRRWVWWFDDTLTQIGLGYPFLFLIAVRPKRDWWIFLSAILVGYWLWFALSPVPASDFNYANVGVSPEWLNAHGLTGFPAHWQKNSNAAFEFDRWFLNLFPSPKPYGTASGLTTLNFIPSIGTMILGLVGGEVLRSARLPWQKVRRLCIIGLLLVSVGWMLGVLGVCPVVKAIWTPSWVLFSGGWCFLFLAAFHALVDLGGYTRVVFPLTVIGMNSIVAYSMSHLYPALAFNSLRGLMGNTMFTFLGEAYEPFLYGCCILIAYWLVLFLLYRRRIFVRI